MRSGSTSIACRCWMSPAPGAHQVIGDRAYADNPGDVARLGRAAARGLMAGGVMPVMKHIPGHGRALADSHLELPRVKASREELETDFAPFRANADLPAAMTAHVVYEALDPSSPATLFARRARKCRARRDRFRRPADDRRPLDEGAGAGRFSSARRGRSPPASIWPCIAMAISPKRGAVARAAPVLAGGSLARVERAREAVKVAVAAAERAAAPFDPVEARAELFAALAALA